MFCPKCDKYLDKDKTIKGNPRYISGNKVIEYESICPGCSTRMGKVYWDKLFVDETYFSKDLGPALRPPLVLENNEAKQENKMPERRNATNIKTCPHCGKPLPENF